MSQEECHGFLMKNVFAGLTNLNTGFDNPTIPHFGPEDFGVVINRCERMKVQIHGIEVFVNNIEFIECVIAQDDEYGWARDLVDAYRGKTEVSFSATYSEPPIAE